MIESCYGCDQRRATCELTDHLCNEKCNQSKACKYHKHIAFVSCLEITDNRNRTASEVRHYFDKYGGNMGATGCVSWSFDKKGVIVINDEDQELEEDKVMEDALEAGAADFAPDEGVYTVYTDPDDVASVAEALTNDGYELLSAQAEMVPQNTIKLTDEGDIKNLQKMLDMFEDNDDVQNVWHNWEE